MFHIYLPFRYRFNAMQSYAPLSLVPASDGSVLRLYHSPEHLALTRAFYVLRSPSPSGNNVHTYYPYPICTILPPSSRLGTPLSLALPTTILEACVFIMSPNLLHTLTASIIVSYYFLAVSAYECTQFNVPINVSANTNQLAVSTPSNQSQLTGLVQAVFSETSNVTAQDVGNFSLLTRSYTIWSQLCVPDGFVSGTLEFAIHGYALAYFIELILSSTQRVGIVQNQP